MEGSITFSYCSLAHSDFGVAVAIGYYESSTFNKKQTQSEDDLQWKAP